MINWFNDILKDEDKMQIISTILIVIIPFVAFALWVGFLKNFKLEGFSFREVGIFTLIYLYAVLTNRIKFRQNGKRTEINNNEELQADIKKINEIKFDRREDNIGMEFVNKLNKETQETKNRQKTEIVINKLLDKKRHLMFNNKPYEHIDKKIDMLEKNNLIDTKFKLYSYKDITNNNINMLNSNLKEDGSSLRYNVSMTGFKRAFAIELAKGIGYGSAILGFAWGLPLDVTIAYISFLILGIVVTAISQTIFSAIDTRGNYHKSLKIKLNIMKECREYIDNVVTTHKNIPTTDLKVDKDIEVVECENTLKSEIGG